MISHAYIHEYGNGELEPEHLAVKQVLESRGIPCELFTAKRLSRNQLNLGPSTLVVGDHPTMEAVFKRLKYSYSNDCYPVSLRSFLQRQIWQSTVKHLLMGRMHSDYPIFIKPKSRAKLFTGLVLQSQADLYRLDTIPKKTEIYGSSVVNWVSEFRVFVNRGEIVGVRHYDGDPSLRLNMDVVQRSVVQFEASDEHTASYGIDFGVLEQGETTLIEWNDGFALGAYGLDAEVYTDLLLERWKEIVGSLHEK
ncbi:ATP-grasp domain-containing protein [Pontibacter sp. G13]|uniref:ATP-grasp domain-containing protein n=1 Tax=Pontibacter sp. G13 TaxID=3074898 RepID=UPI002889E357|nr:ATP-grasp domain-containing protein [Pontibacter sp. G13]WNJ19060.1 ATP-grasp domain-containing protein [Pontibacter sp. G13]